MYYVVGYRGTAWICDILRSGLGGVDYEGRITKDGLGGGGLRGGGLGAD